MPLMYGPPSPHSGSFVQPVMASLQEGRTVRLFTDEVRGPVSTVDAAEGLLHIATSSNYTGPLNMGGPEALSRFDMGIRLAEAFQLDKSLIAPCKQADVNTRAPRARDVFMTSDRAFALGYQPLTMARALCRHMSR